MVTFTSAGEAANVVIDGTRAFVSLGERGLEVVDIASGKVLEVVAPTPAHPGRRSHFNIYLHDSVSEQLNLYQAR